MSGNGFNLPPSPEASDPEEDPAVEAPAELLAYADGWLPISESRSRRQTEDSVEEDLGSQCLLCEGNGKCPPTRQQLDVVAAQIAEELDAVERGVTEYGETQGDQGRILDIRVEDWKSVVIFAHIEQLLGPEEKERLRDQACMALHALEDAPTEGTIC